MRYVPATRTVPMAGMVCSSPSWRERKLSRIYLRADAAFAMPEVYEFLEAERIKYAIRLPANQILQHRIGYLLKRPDDHRTRCVGSMPISPIRREAGPSRAG